MFPALLIFALLFGFAVALEKPTDCYFATGELATLTSPCHDGSSGLTSLCCTHGDMCLNNTLCAKSLGGGESMHYRGTCTDSTWASPSCPRFCVGDENKSTTVAVFLCGDNKDGTLQWYCGEQSPTKKDATCNLSKGSFVLTDNFTTYAIAPFPAHVDDPRPNPANSSATHGSTSITREQGNILPSATSTTTRQDAADPGPTIAVPSDTPKHEGKTSSRVAIGFGVGIAILIVVAASIPGFFCLRRRRRDMLVRAETPPPFVIPGIGGEAPGPLGRFHRAKLA